MFLNLFTYLTMPVLWGSVQPSRVWSQVCWIKWKELSTPLSNEKSNKRGWPGRTLRQEALVCGEGTKWLCPGLMPNIQCKMVSGWCKLSLSLTFGNLVHLKGVLWANGFSSHWRIGLSSESDSTKCELGWHRVSWNSGTDLPQ